MSPAPVGSIHRHHVDYRGPAVAYDTSVLKTLRKSRTVLEKPGEQPTAWVLNPTDLEAPWTPREDGATGGFLLDSAAADTIFGPGIARVPSLAVPGRHCAAGGPAQVAIGSPGRRHAWPLPRPGLSGRPTV